MTKFYKLLIGRAEPIDFPMLGLEAVPAKVDTGAFRSAIHAKDLKIVTIDGTETLQGSILGGNSFHQEGVPFVTSDFRVITVENSFGHSEERYEIKLDVKIGIRTFKTSFSLADRSTKIYPVLIGRKFLNGRFLIDTTLANINRLDLKKKHGIVIPPDEDESEPES